MHDFKKFVFVGIDPHKDQHVAIMVDHWGEVFLELSFPNQPKGFQELLDQVETHTPKDRVAVFGIEDTGGLGRPCSQWLTLRNKLVKGVNPVMTSDRRKRRPHRAKTDKLDAAAVAKVLIENFNTLPQVTEDQYYHGLRELINRRTQLVKTRTRYKNEFHRLIHGHYPDYKQIFCDPFGSTALAFWHKYPHPSSLQKVGVKRLGSFLQKHARNMSTKKATEILSSIDKTQSVSLEARINIPIIRQLIESIQQIDRHIEEIETLIAETLKQCNLHLDTLPGVADVTVASLLARIGPIKKFSSADKLARHAGIAPEDDSSGNKKRHRRSKSGDRQLNAVIHQIALNQISISKNGTIKCPAAYEYYQRKISEGKTKLSALACLKRRLCDIIFAMMRNETRYKHPQPNINFKHSVAQ